MVTPFNDPYDCQACRDHQKICKFHIKMYGAPKEYMAFAPGITIEQNPNAEAFMQIQILHGNDVEICSLVDGTTVICVREKEVV